MVRRSGGQANGQPQEPTVAQVSGRPAARAPDRPHCNRCGFEVISRAWGCKNPCPNCGTVYPLGDCSD